MTDETKQPDEKKEQPKTQEKPKNIEDKTPIAKASSKLAKIIEEIEKLSVIELAELVKALEEKFGVSAIPAISPAAAPVPGGESPKEETATSAQTTFNVTLAATGDNKIGVIKAVREINQTLGLKEAKDLVESAPKDILTGANKETAEEAKKKLEAAGAKVELK